MQAAGYRRLCDMQVLANFLKTQLDQGALSLKEQSLFLDLVGVLHAVVELGQELRKERFELLVGSSWLREAPVLLLLKQKVADFVVVVADLLEIALSEAAAVLLDPYGPSADRLRRMRQDLTLHGIGPLRGTCEH